MIFPSRLQELLGRFRRQRVLVIGDLMLDEFIWGRVSRISPEAPVPIVEVTEESAFPGGAANVARNLREFTPGVSVMGIVGEDAHAQRLRGLLVETGINLEGVQSSPGCRTTVKTRVIARQQHVVRFDRETPAAPGPEVHARALAHLESALPELDAIIIEDYAKGFLTQEFVDAVGALAQRAGKVLTVDPNPRNDLRWTGATAIKPNRSEAFHAAGVRLSEPVDPPEADPALLAVGARLFEKWHARMLLVTLSEQGMILFRRDEPPLTLPPRRREVFDVSGAGDTAISAFTLTLAAGGTPAEAAEIANHAASVVIGKLGTATLTPDELLASFAHDAHA